KTKYIKITKNNKNFDSLIYLLKNPEQINLLNEEQKNIYRQTFDENNAIMNYGCWVVNPSLEDVKQSKKRKHKSHNSNEIEDDYLGKNFENSQRDGIFDELPPIKCQQKFNFYYPFSQFGLVQQPQHQNFNNGKNKQINQLPLNIPLYRYNKQIQQQQLFSQRKQHKLSRFGLETIQEEEILPKESENTKNEYFLSKKENLQNRDKKESIPFTSVDYFSDKQFNGGLLDDVIKQQLIVRKPKEGSSTFYQKANYSPTNLGNH
ncbi:hypothetical protein Mgra_00007425, partial [Meloidogyne graminicola]